MAEGCPGCEALAAAVELMLDGLETAEYVLGEDVAWIRLSADQLAAVPGVSQMCPVREVPYKRHRDVEFRFSPGTQSRTDAAALRRYVAWNATKRTRKQLNMRGLPRDDG